MASFSLAYKLCTINIDGSEELAEVIENLIEPESSAVSPNYSNNYKDLLVFSICLNLKNSSGVTKIVDFPPNLIDPSPFQLVEKTSLNKVTLLSRTVVLDM